MTEFAIHTLESAPDDSKDVLKKAKEEFGFIPNIHGAMAESPSVLKAYWSLGVEISRSSLGPLEQQVLLLAVSLANRCAYCTAAHSVAARLAGLPDEELKALRAGTGMSDPRLEALRAFTDTVVEKRGRVSPAEIESFVSAGFTKAQVLEVMLGVVYKTLSNYTNHAIGAPLDHQFEKMKWEPPEGA